jgi:hypothetical protein
MLHSFHDRFGTAGVVIGVIALIVALGGTAFAAAGLNTKQKKEVTKIAKKYAGKPGAAGATGATGPAGSAGAKGDTGNTGGTGDPGKSVVVTEIEPEEPECAGNGGAEVKQEGAAEGTEVCNGSPWTVDGGLPQSKTLTGAWGPTSASIGVDLGGGPIAGTMSSGTAYMNQVSFELPLAAGQFGRIRYLCSPRALPYVSRAVGRLSSAAAIEVEPLGEIEDSLALARPGSVSP